MSRTRVYRFVSALLFASLLLAFSADARARRSDAHRYRFEQVWSSVVRLIRVDYRFPVRDRDRDIGYVLFDYEHAGRTHPGSVELVRFQEGNHEQVRVTVQIPAMPSYIERMILDRLVRKLREDHGEPFEVISAPSRAEEEPEEDDEETSDENASEE